MTNNLVREFSEVMHPVTEFSEVTCNDSSSTNMANGTSFSETAEMPQTLERQEHNNIIITELQEKLSVALLKIEELEAVVLQLKAKIVDLEQKNEQLKEQMLSLTNISSNDSLVAFYTGFPNYETMVAYDFLDPGARGENVNYWLSGKEIAGNAKPVKQRRPRSLKPVDEFFLTLCRLRQGFAELRVAHLFNVSQPTEQNQQNLYFLDKLCI